MNVFSSDEEGKKGARLQFRLQGLRRRANVEMDVRENQNGKMQTRYIILATDDMYRNTVIVEDNRQ